jgi:hypothetical protein
MYIEAAAAGGILILAINQESREAVCPIAIPIPCRLTENRTTMLQLIKTTYVDCQVMATRLV